MNENIDAIISEVSAKDSHVLCREVMSITDTMDVLRALRYGIEHFDMGALTHIRQNKQTL